MFSYLVGTEDGQIHKCSCSYNEQYLNTYASHTGPVNRVKWSPFVSSVFMSCSTDWTARLWHQDSEEEIFKFQSGRDNIPDIAWSPHSSTCFGMVSSDGRLEIWDLSVSVYFNINLFLDWILLLPTVFSIVNSLPFLLQTSHRPLQPVMILVQCYYINSAKMVKKKMQRFQDWCHHMRR
jgi:WD40 repeat protein